MASFSRTREGKSVRVGELDEEMVFESHPNETFILGASTWRIEDITHDRVLVSPAPGEPGKMPFWKGDGPGRPLEFGRRIGALVRELRALPKPAALTRLVAEHDLDPGAAENLLQFLADQEAATGQVPDDRTIVIERSRDELGDWRVCVLTPFGSRIHIPWAMAVSARIRAAGGPEVETLWGDDGFVLRFPDTDEPPDPDWFLVESAEAMQLVLRQLGSTALFAGRFREAAGRALLLPRRRADQRSPLWQLRKRSYDLLSVASRYPSFPLLLEAYRECLRDVFDMPALIETLRAIEQRQLRVHVVETHKPSPFASSLLFSYVANFIYDGDAPLAERRAQALTIDQDQLRELLGEADLRELLDADAIAEVEETAQCLAESIARVRPTASTTCCLRLGDLSREELARRVATPDCWTHVDRLIRARRLLELRIAGERRLIAVEDAARYRDALGDSAAAGTCRRRSWSRWRSRCWNWCAAMRARMGRSRCARRRIGLRSMRRRWRTRCGSSRIEGRVLEGGFRPGGLHREWCDAEILRQIRRKSLAKLRREVEPVEQHTLARFLTHWQGLLAPRRSGPCASRCAAGCDREPAGRAAARIAAGDRRFCLRALAGTNPRGLDTLIAAGEVTWAGVEPIGRTRRAHRAFTSPTSCRCSGAAAAACIGAAHRARREAAALFSNRRERASLIRCTRPWAAAIPGETIDALWSLVWRGLVTNDSLHALRAYTARPETCATQRPIADGSGVSLAADHAAECARTLVAAAAARGRRRAMSSDRVRPKASHALALQLLNRYGVLMREPVAAENVPGGFSAVYDVLKALEESGRIRRGYFVAGLGATQFALPAAVDLLRQLRTRPPRRSRSSCNWPQPIRPIRMVRFCAGPICRWRMKIQNRRRACSRAPLMRK